jgi:DNA-binding CsgD family transcriptional regulator/tetratricopeptide (TPR) repeat protein
MQDAELLERVGELQVLDAMIVEACRGVGRLVAVEGPAGIGKTRLLVAARFRAQRAGMPVLVARGSQLEQDFAYGVVRQLFEPVLASADQAKRDHLLAGAAAQAAVLFDQVDTVVGGEDISFALLHGLFWLTANLAERPLMLVVDDLHWSDGPSLRFLAYLMPRLEGLPLLMVLGLRPAEPSVNQHLLAYITTDPLSRVVRPAPLSKKASAQLVRTVLAGQPEDAFCLACHTATGGNPLLLRELADAAAAEGLEATAAGAARLHEIGPQAVKRRVALRLTQLGPSAVAFCGALAILGDGANPAHVAHLAGLEPAAALRTARQLIDIDILHKSQLSSTDASSTEKLSFVHPLVRAAVYEGLTATARLEGHARAARLLAAEGEAPERVAAHLLLTPPAGDEFIVATLRRAADQVFAQGSPDSAVSYLERCLQEPPNKERADVLLQLGTAAQLIDAAKSANYLTAAMAAAEDPQRKVAIAEMLGITLFNAGRGGEAAEVMSQAIQALSTEDSDLRKRIQALLIHTSLVDPVRSQFGTESISKLRCRPSDTGLGSRMLDVTIAFHDLLAGTNSKTAVMLARRGLSDGSLIEQVNPLSVYGCYVLIAADLNEVVPLLESWIAVAHQRGSMFALAPAKCFRGLAWLSRGALAEAEANLRDSLWAVMTTSQKVGVPVVTAYLADTLMEQGNLHEADTILKVTSGPELHQTGYWAWLLGSRAHMLMLQERIQEGLQTWLACGRRFAAHGGQNPAVLAWRSGAALALHRLSRGEEAQELATQEIILARRWGAPTALGRALRVAGLIRGGQDGLDLLRESTMILASSPARLEYAKSLVDLGAALRRAGRRSESRQHLYFGVELAQICGATPLVERGWTELRASGARRRHVVPSGPDALTPSERRVAELAAAGYTNRDIAQTLFITTNTVEVHLTRTYRKLGINGRASLGCFSFSRPDEQPTATLGAVTDGRE